MHRLWHKAKAQVGRLLRVLLLRLGAVSANSGPARRRAGRGVLLCLVGDEQPDAGSLAFDMCPYRHRYRPYLCEDDIVMIGGASINQHQSRIAVLSSRTTDIHAAFVDYLERGLLAVNTPELQRLSVTLYRLLARAAPLAPAELALACELSEERLEQQFSQLLPTSLETDERGAIVAFGGLSLRPTRHQFVAAGTKLYTWCVFDALFLPQILNNPATLVTRCPISQNELIVELAPRESRVAEPSDWVMSIVAPDHEACCRDLRRAFCDRINLFGDRAAFAQWSFGRNDTDWIPLAEAQFLARRRNELQYPAVALAG
jgi:alkylmercury lyase